MKIKFTPESPYLSYLGFNFASFELTSKEQGKQKTGPVACKETFSTQALLDAKKDKTFNVLLFFTPFENKTKSLKVKNTLDLLNKLETRMKFPLSKVYEIEKSPATFCLAITSSSKWAKTSPLIHLYLIIIRNASTHPLSNSWVKTLKGWIEDAPLFQVTDRQQFRTIGWDLIKKIIKQEGDLPSLTVVKSEYKYMWSASAKHFLYKLVKKKIEAKQPELDGMGICQFSTQLKKMKGAKA